MSAYTPTNQFNFTVGNYTPSNQFNFIAGEIVDVTGVLHAPLDDVTVSLAAEMPVRATLHATLETVRAVFVADIEQAAVIAATLQNVGVEFFAEQVLNRGVLHAVLDDVAVNALAIYDPNVTRFTTLTTKSPWQDAAQGISHQSLSMRDQADYQPVPVLSRQQQARPLHLKRQMQTDVADQLSVRLCSRITPAQQSINQTVMPVQQADPVDRRLCLHNEAATPRRSLTGAITQQMTKVYPDRWLVPVQDTAETQTDFTRQAWLEPPPEHRYAPNTVFNFDRHDYSGQPIYEWLFGQSILLSVGHSLGITSAGFDSAWQRATWSGRRLCSLFQQARRPPPGKSPWIDKPRPEPNPEPPSGDTITIPVYEVYHMQHIISATLTDLTPIQLDDIRLALDADSYAWTFSAQLLDPAQIGLVKPLANGDSVTLIVTINGYIWHVLVEQVRDRRRFGERTIELVGRGISALLSSPYQPVQSGTQGDLLGMVQLAELHLPFGWTLDWQAVNWNVTGGVYSYQDRTPLQAVADLAESAGAIVVPARDSQTVRVMPRYPVLPWQFGSVEPDVIVPTAAILEITHRPTAVAEANGVYIHGGELGGVLGFCRLNSTAGDVLVPTVSDPLMTDVIGVRARAERLLSGQAIQPEIENFTLPMDGDDIPLLEIGNFIAITDGETEIRGIVNTLELRASGAEVEQTVYLGENTNNKWLAFRSLLPKDPLLVGRLISTSGNISVMQLIDGGVMTVRGTGTINNQYYIRSGQIQGDAPSLTLEEVVI